MRRMFLLMLIAVFIFTSGFSIFKKEDKDVSNGNASYDDQEYPDATNHYAAAEQRLGKVAEIQYNMGNALFKQEKLDEAMDAYLGALTKADDKLKGKLYYNMGNLLLKQGKLNEAIDSYKRSLKVTPGDRDAIFNLELAQHILEEQKKKQQEQQDQENQDQQNQDQQNQDQEKQDSENQDQQNQDQQNKDSENQDQQDQQDKKEQEDQKQSEEDKEGQQQEQQQQQQQQQGEQQKEDQQAGDQKNQKQMKAMPVKKSEAEELLDKMREEEKSLQMQMFMLDKGQTKQMEQDW